MKVALVILSYVTLSFGANILGVFNHPGASHTKLGKVLLTNLAKKGHQVVMISSFPLKNSAPHYKDIYLDKHLDDLKRRNNQTQVIGFQELRNMTLQHTEDTFTHPEVKKLINSNQTFDVIIIDWFYNEATLMFGEIFKAPVIYISSFGNMMFLNDFTGNYLPVSYVPGAGLFASDKMSFTHRNIMTIVNVLNSLLSFRRYNAHHEILNRHFNNPPSIERLQENVALVLSNSHYSFETPRPYTPNIIPVGGFHVEDPKTLPEDIQQFLDNAKEGVIYFSLGSQVKSSLFDKLLLTKIITVLSKLPQKILWKYEDSLEELPENVKILKWLPQNDVLAHPNVKLFITHGGMLSLIEAIHHHVPLLCIPFFGDQLTNAAFIESRSIGIYLSPDNIDEVNFFNAVTEVLSNPMYKEQITFRSSLLRDQVAKPLETAIYWVEHVIKHKQGKHLRTFATKLPWYEYYLIDVILFLTSIILVTVLIVLKIIKFVFHKTFKNKQKKE